MLEAGDFGSLPIYTAIMVHTNTCTTDPLSQYVVMSKLKIVSLSPIFIAFLYFPHPSLSFIPSLFLIFSFSFLSSLYLNFLPFLLPFSPLLSCLSSLALSLSLINISQFLTCTSFSSVVVAALWFCIGIVPLGLWALIKQQTNINTMRQH